LSAIPELLIAEREVHIWTERLPLSTSSVLEAKKLLSQTEITRADRFHHRRDHDRYVAAHARLREILSKYTAICAPELQFASGEFGKPSLDPSNNPHQINFSLSHSGDWFLLGIVRNARIGVDIEEITPESATSDVAERFFTKRENAELQTLSSDQRVIAFFNCWTRKEAYLKALGCGLSASPTDCDVTFLPEAPPEIRQRIPTDSGDWSLFHLSGDGYVAAAAIDQKPVTLTTKNG
jgi:4'-phosphopantetheinyl transferase